MRERKDKDPQKLVIGKQKDPEPTTAPEPESDPDEAHSRLGPSSSERWLNCTASVEFTAGMPDRDSEFAAEGTAAHTLSEWVREQRKPAKRFAGQEIGAKGRSFKVDGEMHAAVQRFVDYVEELPGDAYYEERVHYTAWVPNGWGTADDIRITDDGHCYVTDLKYGKGVQVFAKNNSQLMLYALGVFQEFGHLYDIKHIHIAVHQPRLDHVDEWDISIKDLLIWARDVVKATSDDIAAGRVEFKPGEWCRFCPGKSVCEARSEAMQAEYLADLDGDVDQLPNYKLGEIMDRIPEIKAWISDMEARALSEVQKGNPVPGKDGDYKLVAGRSSRSWKDEKEAETALRKKLKVKEIFPPKMISPAQAEKHLGKKNPVLESLIKKSQGRPVLVTGADPRPPLQVSAEDEFDDLGDEAQED